MPIYEYEPTEFDCLICDGRVGVLQGVNEEALEHCPHCGMKVKRVVSTVQISTRSSVDFDKAAGKGFTTFRKSEKGVWEKIAGEGANTLATAPDSGAAPPETANKPKVLDLDKKNP
ncbi:MAG: hypothetical protein JST40_09125 [Armatimonadetes bacterium]|nr:hypothetical protein [Armatimonadota bacterium]